MKRSPDPSEHAWSEDDSLLYRDIAAIAVPAREEQIATILALLPFDRLDAFRVVELGSGPGTLSHALLRCFPQTSLLALDGSESMRAHSTKRLAEFSQRFQARSFDLGKPDWYSHLDAADAVISSLCLHHLSGDEKRRLFTMVFGKTSPRGSFLIADLIEPQFPNARDLYASAWDREARHRSRTRPELFETFVSEKWNYYRFPDPADRPSSLIDQLEWLRQAGFPIVDCFWLQAGHAVCGGIKQPRQGPGGVSFADAHRCAEEACRSTG